MIQGARDLDKTTVSRHFRAVSATSMNTMNHIVWRFMMDGLKKGRLGKSTLSAGLDYFVCTSVWFESSRQSNCFTPFGGFFSLIILIFFFAPFSGFLGSGLKSLQKPTVLRIFNSIFIISGSTADQITYKRSAGGGKFKNTAGLQ